ncbi:MAG: hypothetical protein M1813_006475 [Trichoglossum hirsutum]|nr:MAG: hypothetical protein M1813_006475 [Trichoglossum hirsutum]
MAVVSTAGAAFTLPHHSNLLRLQQIEALENKENLDFWRQLGYLQASILTVSLAGMIQSWTQSNSRDVNARMPTELGLHIGAYVLDGVLNATPFLATALLETKNESDGLLELPGYVLYGGDAEDD